MDRAASGAEDFFQSDVTASGLPPIHALALAVASNSCELSSAAAAQSRVKALEKKLRSQASDVAASRTGSSADPG